MTETLGIPARWAVRGKPPGAMKDYSILADDSGGPRRDAYAGLIRALVTSNPPSGDSGRPDALPWVYFAPFQLQGEQRRLSFAVSEWSAEGAVDHSGRPVMVTRYFDAPWDRLRAGGAGFADLYDAALRIRLKDGTPAEIGPAPIRLQRVAEVIRKHGPDRLIRLAAALLDDPVVIRSDEPLGLSDRLQLLDAVASLLPYGLRSDLAAGTWTPNDAPHPLRLMFSDRATQTQRSAYLDDRPLPFHSGYAVDYADRCERILRTKGLDALLKALWERRSNLGFSHLGPVLDTLAAEDRAYALVQDLRSGAVDVAAAISRLKEPETSLAGMEPAQAAYLVGKIVREAPPKRFTAFALHMSEPAIRDAVVAEAVASEDSDKAIHLWNAARKAEMEVEFLRLVARAVTSEQDERRAGAFLGRMTVAEYPDLRAAVIRRPNLVSWILLAAVREPNVLMSWNGLLYVGRDRASLPLWMRLVADIGDGRDPLSVEQVLDDADGGRMMAVALLSTAIAAHRPGSFLACPPLWDRLHRQLMGREPDIAEAFIEAVAGLSHQPVDAAGIDLLLVANGTALRSLVCDTVADATEIDTYFRGLAERFARMPLPVRADAGAAVVRAVIGAGLTSRRIDHAMRIAEVIGIPALKTELHRDIAYAVAQYPGVLVMCEQSTVDYLVTLSPELGRAVLELRLTQAADNGVEHEDMEHRCHQALVSGLPMAAVLSAIKRWPHARPDGLFELVNDLSARYLERSPTNASRLFEEGIRHILAGGLGYDLGNEFRTWLTRHVDSERARLNALHKMVKTTKLAKPGLAPRLTGGPST